MSASTGNKPPSVPEREIDVTFQIASGGFGPGGQDTVTLSGLAVYAEIQVAGLTQGSSASFRIQGMTQEMMNRLSMAAPQYSQTTSNTISISAGTVGSYKSLLFTGNPYEAYADFSQSPESGFVVNAYASLVIGSQPISPTSSKGRTATAALLATVAAKCGLGFQNYGVTGSIMNPSFDGCGDIQIENICKASVPRAVTSSDGITLSAFQEGQGLANSTLPIVSAATGLVGYPSYSQWGADFQTIFNPSLSFYGVVQIDSSYLPAGWTNLQGPGGKPTSNGQYMIYELTHELQTQEAGGPWFTSVKAIPNGGTLPTSS